MPFLNEKHTLFSLREKQDLDISERTTRFIVPSPARPQPAPNSIALFPFNLDGQNLPFLLFFSCKYKVRHWHQQQQIKLRKRRTVKESPQIKPITRNLANTIDASHTVVPRCFELGSCKQRKIQTSWEWQHRSYENHIESRSMTTWEICRRWPISSSVIADVLGEFSLPSDATVRETGIHRKSVEQPNLC